IGRRRLPVGGDILLEFQGRTINSVQELATEVDRYKAGEKVTVTILRGNRKMEIPMTLAEAPRQEWPLLTCCHRGNGLSGGGWFSLESSCCSESGSMAARSQGC